MFDFGMFKHFLLSACYVLRHVWAFGMFKFGHLHAKMRSFRHVSSFRVLRHVWFWQVRYFLLSACCIPHTHTPYSVSCMQTIMSCRSCRSVLVALAQLEVADNSSSTHTTTTQLQLVSQGKDAVIGSSLVALVVLAQRGKKRSVQCNSFWFGDLSPTWKEAAEADIAEDSVTTTTTTSRQWSFCGQHL